MSTPVHESEEQYDGPAVLVADDGGEVAVNARLRGHFEPIDGRFHWYGRVSSDDDSAALTTGSTVELRTPYGAAAGRLSDLDPWGRLRITGTGRPPF